MYKFKPLDIVAWTKHEDAVTIIETLKNNEYKVITTSSGPFVAKEEDLVLITPNKTKKKYEYLAMYVIVKDTAPIGLGINACTHAGFMAGINFGGQDYEDWLNHSFRKRTCLVTPEQFDACIREIEFVNGDYVVFKENDWNDQELSAAFSPMYNFPRIFKTLKLHPGFV
jgi:hypothetical protein